MHTLPLPLSLSLSLSLSVSIDIVKILAYICVCESVCVCVSECVRVWRWVCACVYHHHHVMPPARISLSLSRHFSQSSIASGRSSWLHPVSSHSCCMYVLAGRPAFARPYTGVHRSTLLMSSSLLLQQCPACLVRLTWIVFVMRGRWSYSCCFVGWCRQDLFNIYREYYIYIGRTRGVLVIVVK